MASGPPYKWTIKLKPDEENYIGPIKLKRGVIATISCTGDRLFYAGIFDRDDYFKKLGAAGGRFDFPFGTDRKGFTKALPIVKTDDYYIVIRDGVFSSPVTIEVRLDIEELSNYE